MMHIQNLFKGINKAFSKMLVLSAFMLAISDPVIAVIVSLFVSIMLLLTISLGLVLKNKLSTGQLNVVLLALNSILIKIEMLIVKDQKNLFSILVVSAVMYLAYEITDNFTRKFSFAYITGVNLTICLTTCIASLFSVFFAASSGYLLIFMGLCVCLYNRMMRLNNDNL